MLQLKDVTLRWRLRVKGVEEDLDREYKKYMEYFKVTEDFSQSAMVS